MHPILIELSNGYRFHAYGTLILTAIVSSVPLVAWDLRHRRLGVPLGTFLVDLYLTLVVGALVGGRLFYAATQGERLLREPFAVLFATSGSGFVFYGSFLVTLAGLEHLRRRHGLEAHVLPDVLTTWLPLGHMVSRLGCFLAGCCYGAPCPAPNLACVRFPAGSIAFGDPSLHVAEHPHETIAIHPTQLYDAALCACVAALVIGLRVRGRGVPPPWRITGTYLLTYGAGRLLVEVFRGDVARGYLGVLRLPSLATMLGLPPQHPLGLSVSQVVSLGFVAGGLALVWLHRPRRGSAPKAPAV